MNRTTIQGAFLSGICSVLTILILTGAGNVPVKNLLPEGSMQGDLNAGGRSITNAGTVQSTGIITAAISGAATNQFDSIGAASAAQSASSPVPVHMAFSTSITYNPATMRGAILDMTTGTNTITVAVPAASSNTNQFFTVRKADSGSGNVQIPGTTAATSIYVMGHDTRISSDGTVWQHADRGGATDASGNHTETYAGNFTVNAGALLSSKGVTSTAATPLIGYMGFDLNNQGMMLGVSKGGHAFNARFIGYVPPDGGNSRDVSLLLDSTTQLPLKMNGLYWTTYTAGIFGYMNYIGIASSPDMANWTNVAQVPIVGTAVGSVSTTATAASGAGTITLPGTAIGGLTNGRLYSVTGSAGLPANTCIVYNSSSTTQTLGHQNINGSFTLNSDTVTTSGAVSGAVRLTFIANAWSPTWYVDASGNAGILLRVSTVIGNAYTTPGIGYITCSNPGTFTAWSDFTVLSGVHNYANNGSILNLSGTWYLFADEGNAARSNASDLSYYTASAPTGPYTFQGFMGVGAAYQSAFSAVSVESNQPLYLGGTSWRVYFANQSNGSLFYTESSTGLTGAWTAPVAVSAPQLLDGFGAGHPFFLSQSDDAFAAQAAVAPQPVGIVFGWLNSLGRAVMNFLNDYGSISGSGATIQFTPGGVVSILGRTAMTVNIQDSGLAQAPLFIRNQNSEGYSGFEFDDLNGNQMGKAGWFNSGDVPGNCFGIVCYNHPIVFMGPMGGNVEVGQFATNGDLILDLGNLMIGTVGKGIQIKEGTNGRQGTATLASGTVTVANTTVTASTRFFLTPHGSTISAVGISSVVAGTSFTIKSASGSDANTVDYLMTEPKP